MSQDRKTLKLHEDTKARLDGLKRDHETWDQFFERVADVLSAGAGRDRAAEHTLKECANCGALLRSHVLVDGDPHCFDCAGQGRRADSANR